MLNYQTELNQVRIYHCLISEREILRYENHNLEDVVTPVNIQRYAELLRESGYDDEKSQYLVQGFREGFSIEYEGPENVRRKAPNLKLTAGDEVDLWNKVMKEVKLKRFAGPFKDPPFEYFIQSPIGLVPKDGGNDSRLIFHLSYPRGVPAGEEGSSVNINTPPSKCKVKYPDFADAVRRCLEEGKFCFVAKSDMVSAFRNLGVLKRHWRFLLMIAKCPVDNKIYWFVDKCVLFGSSASCKIFQSFSDSVAHIVQWKINNGKKVINYLDDYLFAALLKIVCDEQVKTFLKVCEEINFPVSLEKTFWGTTQLTFLGFLLDTVRQLILIPREKLSKAMNLVQHVLHKHNRKITVLQLQKLCGYLNFISRAVLPGRAFTRRLYAFINPKLKQYHHIRVNSEMRMDLEIWSQFLSHQSAFARSFIDFSEIKTADEILFYTDASKNPLLGFGGFCMKSWMIQRWDYDFITTNDSSIQFLELYAVVAAAIAWLNRFKNSRIVIFVDNESVVNMLNSMTSSCKNCMNLIRIVVLLQMTLNIRLFAKHVKSENNDLADDLSRFRLRKFFKKAGHYVEKNPTPVPNQIWPMSKVWDI